MPGTAFNLKSSHDPRSECSHQYPPREGQNKIQRIWMTLLMWVSQSLAQNIVPTSRIDVCPCVLIWYSLLTPSPRLDLCFYSQSRPKAVAWLPLSIHGLHNVRPTFRYCSFSRVSPGYFIEKEASSGQSASPLLCSIFILSIKKKKLICKIYGLCVVFGLWTFLAPEISDFLSSPDHCPSLTTELQQRLEEINM